MQSLGELTVELTGDDSKFQAMLWDAEKQLRMFQAAVFTAVSASIKVFSDLDSAITKSTSMMDLNIGERGHLQRMAQDVSRDSVNSAEQVAAAYRELQRAGFSTVETSNAIRMANDFAVATNMDLVKSTHSVASAMRTLGLVSDNARTQTENMTHLLNLLVKAEQMGGGSADQMATVLGGRLGLELRALKVPLEESVSLIAAFNKAGMGPEEGGQMTLRILNAVQRASVKNAEAWHELGLSALDANGNMRPVADTVADITKKMETMSDGQRRAFLEALGFQDRFTDSQMLALRAIGNTTDYQKQFIKGLKDSGGALDEVTSKQMSSFSAQIDKLWNRIKVLGVALGETLMPIVRIITDLFSGLADILATVARAGAQVTQFINKFNPMTFGGLGFLNDLGGWIGGLVGKLLGMPGREPALPMGPAEATKVEPERHGQISGEPGLRVSPREFEVIALNRFNLQGLAGLPPKPKQEVEDKAVRELLSQLKDYIVNKPPEPSLGLR